MNINNLEEYVSLVVDATVKSGIRRQIEAFRSGFNQVRVALLIPEGFLICKISFHLRSFQSIVIV